VAEPFVRVFLTQSWVEAEIVRGRLEAEGSPSISRATEFLDRGAGVRVTFG